MLKTITFSNDQLTATREALLARIEMLEAVLNQPKIDTNVMFLRDKLDVTRQALDLIDGAA